LSWRFAGLLVRWMGRFVGGNTVGFVGMLLRLRFVVSVFIEFVDLRLGLWDTGCWDLPL